MKTPEEIKAGLEAIAETDSDERCRKVAAISGSYRYFEDVAADALVYINYLEEHVDVFMKAREWKDSDLISRSEVLEKAGWYNLYGGNKSIYAVSVKEIEEILPVLPRELRS